MRKRFFFLGCQVRFVDIAAQLRIAEGTVRNRVKNLLKNGTIRKFTIKSSGIDALVLIKSGTKNLKPVAMEIRKYADEIYEMSGDYDIVAIISADSISILNKKVDKIRSIKSVASTSTAIRMAEA